MPGANCIGFGQASQTKDGSTGTGLDNTTGSPHGIPDGAKGCIITFTGAGVRWRADGTAPTTGVGHYQAANSVLTFDSWTAPGNDWRSILKKLEFSPSSSGTVTLDISYFD